MQQRITFVVRIHIKSINHNNSEIREILLLDLKHIILNNIKKFPDINANDHHAGGMEFKDARRPIESPSTWLILVWLIVFEYIVISELVT